MIEGAHDPLNRSGLFLHQIVRLIKFDEANPGQTRSKKEIGRNPQIDQKPAKNPQKTRPNNTPQDPLGSQEVITISILVHRGHSRKATSPAIGC